jgi:hypothetical protein
VLPPAQAFEDVGHDPAQNPGPVELVLLQRLELACIQPDTATMRAGFDLHLVQRDRSEIVSILRALHQVLPALGLSRGLIRQPSLPLEQLALLLREVLLLVLAGLVLGAHGVLGGVNPGARSAGEDETPS